MNSEGAVANRRRIGSKLAALAHAGRALLPAVLCCLIAKQAPAQTTQSLISGRLIDTETGRPVGGGSVQYWNAATNISGSSRSDASGYYALPLLSPGYYRVRASSPQYQPQEFYDLNLPVSSRVDLDFRLRPLKDVWEQGQYRSVFLPGTRTVVTFYGPDVDSSRSGFVNTARIEAGSLDSAVSDVIDAAEIRDLPLAGRDVYTMLVTQPGVAADVAAARGLGLSAAGQRPSASNFLLDGLENNNYLVTGPLATLAPEAVQEYRISVNNYSAAYGRTAGYIANTVSRSGGQQFHGLGYYYVKNEALNANEFQRNRTGESRKRSRENQGGFQAGGPILKSRLFFSSAADFFASRSALEPQQIQLPSTQFVQDYTAAGSSSRKLLEQFPAPKVTPGPQPWVGTSTLSPPVTVDRLLTIQRLDYRPRSGADQLTARLAYSRVSRPDFIWSPYQDFTSGLQQSSLGLAGSYQTALRPNLTNEAKAGHTRDDLHWDRAHPEIPTLISADATILPGSLAFYAYKNLNPSWELLDNVFWTKGRHLASAGAGLLLRSSEGYLLAGRDGQYGFANAVFFGLDRPDFFSASAARTAVPKLQQPAFDRQYAYKQMFFFVQDNVRLTPNFSFNAGIRYERFGTPRNTGAQKDALVALGAGGGLAESVAAARLIAPGAGDQALYPADNSDWAVRFGFAYNPLGDKRTVFRAAYGIFYDRPFDNLWQNTRNNNIFLPLFSLGRRFDYLQPVAEVLPQFEGRTLLTDFPNVTLYDPNLKTGYAQTYFAGLERQLTENLTVEVKGQGSLGRKLITTDVINRQFTTTSGDGRLNPDLPDIAYRAGQGNSNYHALTAVGRYRARRQQFQVSYTWSHAIDNQSEPLAGDFFDLSFTRLATGGGGFRSAFSRQFDSRVDRGNADFDQRHNLVFFAVVSLPSPASRTFWSAVARDWRASALGAVRSGFPYSVRSVSGALFGRGLILNARADIVRPENTRPASPIAIAGGEQLLLSSGFDQPAASTQGNSGRNAFAGPGFWSTNLSLSRGFPIKWLGEGGRLTLRADAYNLFNHANLNPPDVLLQSTTFGQALYGRRGRDSGFPALTPVNEAARELQLMLRVEF